MKENRTCRVVGIYEAMDAVRIDYASRPEKCTALLCELRLLLVHACQDLTTDVCKIVEWYRNEASQSAHANLVPKAAPPVAPDEDSFIEAEDELLGPDDYAEDCPLSYP